MNINWILDDAVLARHVDCGFPTLADVAKERNFSVYTSSINHTSRQPTQDLPILENSCVVVHGSMEFNRYIEKHYSSKYKWIPGAYYKAKQLTYSAFAPYLYNYMLNDTFQILPWGVFKQRMLDPNSNLHAMAKDTGIFVKPNDNHKLFTGFVIKHDIELEISALEQLRNPDPTDLVVIDIPREISAEFRFVIGNREVVTGSEYRWDGKLDIRTDVDVECEHLANTIAQLEWQPDLVYTCDIGITPNGPKVIELNAFSTSGLYACDTYKIVDKISNIAWLEHIGKLP